VIKDGISDATNPDIDYIAEITDKGLNVAFSVDGLHHPDATIQAYIVGGSGDFNVGYKGQVSWSSEVNVQTSYSLNGGDQALTPAGFNLQPSSQALKDGDLFVFDSNCGLDTILDYGLGDAIKAPGATLETKQDGVYVWFDSSNHVFLQGITNPEVVHMSA
jgi:hypothetical protein